MAQAGYMICFNLGQTVRETLHGYSHWPVRPDHFRDLYRVWHDPGWEPTPTEKHLMSLGCSPYVRHVGVWARKLEQATTVRSIESKEAVVVPAGAWLCVAARGSAWGAPYSMDDEAFHARYVS